jgi:hypothetical protein
MPVGTAAWNKSKEIGKRGDSLHVFSEMTRMANFDSIEPKLHKGLHSFATSILTGVRPYRNGTRSMRELDCLADFESRFRNEARTTGSEISIECFARIAHVSAAYQCPRNVRAANRTACCFLHHRFKLDVDTEVPKSFDDVARTCLARIAKT